MSKYHLYIDESGREQESHPSRFYTLLGCIIDKTAEQDLEIKTNLIKYRYWKRTDVVLHSKEIDLSADDFEIFKNNPELKQEFRTDLINLLHSAPIKVSCCIVDKAEVYGYKVPWKPTTIIAKTADMIVLDFLKFLYSRNATGAIIYEASGYEKDAEYLKAFNKVLTPGWEKKHPEFPDIREHLTSVSFATKLNHDLECEIADLLTYAAVRKHQDALGIRPLPKKSYEEKIVKVLEAKLLSPSAVVRATDKRNYLKDVVGFCTLPAPKPPKKKRTA